MTANLFSRMIPLLHKAIPAGLALKGLSKVNPNLSNFATTALSSGYAADQILDYLRDRIGMSGDTEETERLENSGRALRPDEKRSLKRRKQNEVGKNVATAAIGAAAGLAGMPRSSPNQEQTGRGVMPSEIMQGQPQRPPMQLGGRQPLGITEQSQGIPQEGQTIVPPITPQQQMQAKKRTATQKFGKHQQKNKMVDELYNMYQQGQQNRQQQQLNPEDQALLQMIQQTLQM